jgi:hypothetical protein
MKWTNMTQKQNKPVVVHMAGGPFFTLDFC